MRDRLLTTSTGIRFVTYVTVGVVTGYFAKRNRTLLTELRLLADRDALTGLPNTRVFERAIGERLARDLPFGLIVGGIDELTSGIDADEVLRRVASRLMHSLPPGDEVARIGDDSFAVLTYAGSAGDAGKIAAHLQGSLAADGFAVTFGWAAYPQDGSNALSLYRAADERLYARRVIHRQTTVVPLQSSQPQRSSTTRRSLADRRAASSTSRPATTSSGSTGGGASSRSASTTPS